MSDYAVDAAPSLILSATSVAAGRGAASLVFAAAAGNVLIHYSPCEVKIVFSPLAEPRTILKGPGDILKGVLRYGVSGRFPFNFADVPGGKVILANGIDPMLEWDGSRRPALLVGVPAPETACTFTIGLWFLQDVPSTSTAWSGGQDGEERITTVDNLVLNQWQAYVRYVDRDGNVSDLSPLSEPARIDLADFQIYIDGIASTIAEFEAKYRLVLPFSGATAFKAIDVTTGDFTIGGVRNIYTNVPVPEGPYREKVARRQVLRNTAGQATTYYVDVDTTDLTSTTLIGTNDDSDLLGQEAVPLFDEQGKPLANTHGVPPSWKAAVVSHLGRAFAAADVVYDEGHVAVASDSTTVTGVGTAWPASFVGRLLYVAGAPRGYEIAAVDEFGLGLTLAEAYRGPTDIAALYSIRPAPAERKLVYFTPAGDAGSWPATYALEIVDDGDDITGLMVLTGNLYILESRHTYRFIFKDDPAVGSGIFPESNRGCLNQRCWVQAEDAAYMLDEQGIYKMTDGGVTAISQPIQDLFRDDGPSPLRVNWDVDTRYWHAAYSEVHGTVRFFVAMTGSRLPYHAICYNYRDDRWWLEEYHRPVACSTRANLGIARVLCGTDHREMLALSVGLTDGARGAGSTTRGTASAATACSLSDSAASFGSDATNLAVFLVSGRGKGQWRRIVKRTATRLDLLTPWLIRPAAGDRYVVGGIDFRWRSGWFEFADTQEYDNDRSIEVFYEPKRQGDMDLQLFYDHVEEPRPWSSAVDGAVTITPGDPVAVLDLTQKGGRASQRMESHLETNVSGDRYVSPELSGVQAGEQIRVFRLTLNGVDREG